MFYADQVGLKHIADRLSYYAKETNDPSLEPSPLLKRLAATPMSRRDYLLSVLFSRMLFLVIEVVALVAVGGFAFFFLTF